MTGKGPERCSRQDSGRRADLKAKKNRVSQAAGELGRGEICLAATWEVGTPILQTEAPTNTCTPGRAGRGLDRPRQPWKLARWPLPGAQPRVGTAPRRP